MKVPCCSVCQTRYEEERVPLLLQCGHGFYKECLSRMFSASADTTLSCPRSRHVFQLGNFVQPLRENYAVLALIHSNSNANSSNSRNFHSDYTGSDDDDADGKLDGDDVAGGGRCSQGSHDSSPGGCGPVIEVGSHQEVRLVRRIGDGKGRVGVEMWEAVVGAHERCKHGVAVKKVTIMHGMDTDWVQGQLENLQRASMW